MSIRIAITCSLKRPLIDRPALRRAARAVLHGERIPAAELSLALVDDATSARINWQFLKHRGPTDVITFPLSAVGVIPLAGELVVGLEVAARVAKDRRHSLTDELALYVIHGVLHLCGYDDKTASKRRVIRDRERRYMAELELPDISDD